MKTLYKIFIVIFLLNTSASNAQRNPADYSIFFSEQQFQRHLKYLGSDLFEGRAPGTLGGNLAAKYLALEFDKMKLKPIGQNDTYYQNIPMHSKKASQSSKIILHSSGEEIVCRLYEDFLISRTGTQFFIPDSSELVFAGYGIVAPEFDYNDYQNIEVEDKIVVFIEGEPVSLDSTYFDGDNPTVYSSPEAKQTIAISRGAKGSILIPNIKSNPHYDWGKKIIEFSFPILSFAYSASSSFDVLINPQIADLLFTGCGYSLDQIYDMHFQHSMRSFELQASLSYKGKFYEDSFLAPNIIGMIEGNHPVKKNSYIILSAHYDHLGIGSSVKGDSIYNGVFDNAIGVSALMEIARVITQYKLTTERSIILLLTTGEEFGLLGSEYYVQNPIVPLYKTIANLNIDGMASFDNFKSVIGIGSEYSTLSQILKDVASNNNLVLTSIPQFFKGSNAFSKSDQISFAKVGIPSLLVYEGLDYKNISMNEGISQMIAYAENIYHSPFDDLSQPINYEAVKQHWEILLALTLRLANGDNEPEWYSGAPFINARLLSKAQKR